MATYKKNKKKMEQAILKLQQIKKEEDVKTNTNTTRNGRS
jgi:hypothetical protein